jgi:DNA-binding MarR family transcriptional regulator
MANYANQKRMEILNAELLEHKKNTDTDGYYYPMDYKYIDAAAKELNGNAFKIWLYLLRWRNKGYVFFSPAAIENAMGIKKSSVSDSVKELKLKGIIVEDVDKENKLYFNAVPDGWREKYD